MLGNPASLVVTLFVSLGTLFSSSPKFLSPIPSPRVTNEYTKPPVTQIQKTTKLAIIPFALPSTSPTPTNTPTPSPTPTDTPTPTATPTPTDTPTPTPSATPTPTVTTTPTPTPSAPVDIEALFTEHANHYSVDKDLLKRIASCESGMNSSAENGPYGGMYQFSESSWRSARAQMGMDPDPALRFNPSEAIRTAAFKLSTGGRSAWPNCG